MSKPEDRVTIPDRVGALERQNDTLVAVSAELVAITRALTTHVAILRSEASDGVYDASMPDIEKDLERLSKTLDEPRA